MLEEGTWKGHVRLEIGYVRATCTSCVHIYIYIVHFKFSTKWRFFVSDYFTLRSGLGIYG